MTDVESSHVYWIQHRHKSGAQLRDNDQVHKFLQKRLIHWLETLRWMKKVPEKSIPSRFYRQLLSLVYLITIESLADNLLAIRLPHPIKLHTRSYRAGSALSVRQYRRIRTDDEHDKADFQSLYT